MIIPTLFSLLLVVSAAPATRYASNDPNDPLWNQNSKIDPQPIRGHLGAHILGPQNIRIDLQNPDLLAPPTTDHGTVANSKWPFSLSHNRLQRGGWARQQNVGVLPVATELAGVNMRLQTGAVRELHWHTAAEWAYVLKGDVRITTVTPDGQVYVGDVTEGDLWYFPAGNPHSLQAKNTTNSPDGAEFLLIFDSGEFSEDSTFMLSEWLAHTPKDVLANNFQADISKFDHIPEDALYIFPSSPPPDDVTKDVVIPNNTPLPYTFPLSKVQPKKVQGGSIKVVDSRTFEVSKTISAVEVEVEAGGMSGTLPSLSGLFFISGEARITVFAGESNARTFNFLPGDIAYIPPSFGHYVANTGNTTLKFLEIFKSAIFQDISLNQWLALTPPELVKAHLGFDDDMISKLTRHKQEVVGRHK